MSLSATTQAHAIVFGLHMVAKVGRRRVPFASAHIGGYCAVSLMLLCARVACFTCDCPLPRPLGSHRGVAMPFASCACREATQGPRMKQSVTRRLSRGLRHCPCASHLGHRQQADSKGHGLADLRRHLISLLVGLERHHLALVVLQDGRRLRVERRQPRLESVRVVVLALH